MVNKILIYLNSYKKIIIMDNKKNYLHDITKKNFNGLKIKY